jgi:hypothetical protein
MPPWGAEAGHRELKYDISLSEERVDAILNWLQGGSPEGNSDSPGEAIVLERGELERVDLTLAMPEAYTPAGSPDDYRCFVIEWPEDETTFITGFKGVPGNNKVVHHLVTFLVDPADAETVDAYDDLAEGAGYPCFGGSSPTVGESSGGRPSVITRMIGQWAPGIGAMVLPEGTGMKVEPGSRAIFQVHYNVQSEGPQPDLSSLELQLSTAPLKEGFVIPWLNFMWAMDSANMAIPAGEANVHHSHSASLDTFAQYFTGEPAPNGILVHSVFPHMHRLGRAINVSAVWEGGTEEILVGVPNYDFEWQREYILKEPVLFMPTDQLKLDCWWDNSREGRIERGVDPAEPQSVGWGEGTVDEMCVAVVYVTLP